MCAMDSCLTSCLLSCELTGFDTHLHFDIKVNRFSCFGNVNTHQNALRYKLSFLACTAVTNTLK